MFVGACYIPPKCDRVDVELIKYQRQIDFACESVNSAKVADLCYLFGDFNLPNIDWVPDDVCSKLMVPMNIKAENEIYVVDNLLAVDMLQINGVMNDQNRILDLIFTNNYDCPDVHVASVPLLPDEVFHKSLELSIEYINLISLKVYRTLLNTYFQKNEFCWF